MAPPSTLELAAPGLPRLLEVACGPAVDQVREAPFLRLLGRNQLGRPALVGLLRCLQAVHAELEWALEWHRRHPAVRPLCLQPLWRNVPLQDALWALCGPHWHDSTRLAPVQPHLERLQALSDTHPELLAAHAWALYVADPIGQVLAGTRVPRLAALVRPRSGALQHVAGLGAPCTLLAMRDALGRLSPDGAARARLVEEARRALRLQRWMLDALGRANLQLVALAP